MCGFKRSGKSTLGKQLAEKQGLRFIDTDQLIEEEMGKTCAEIVEMFGEDTFRSCETKAVLKLKSVTNAIIALGGGALLSQENRIFLEGLGKIVYLFLPKHEVKTRLLTPPIPTFLRSDPEKAFEEMWEKRAPIFEQYIRHTI